MPKTERGRGRYTSYCKCKIHDHDNDKDPGLKTYKLNRSDKKLKKKDVDYLFSEGYVVGQDGSICKRCFDQIIIKRQPTQLDTEQRSVDIPSTSQNNKGGEHLVRSNQTSTSCGNSKPRQGDTSSKLSEEETTTAQDHHDCYQECSEVVKRLVKRKSTRSFNDANGRRDLSKVALYYKQKPARKPILSVRGRNAASTCTSQPESQDIQSTSSSIVPVEENYQADSELPSSSAPVDHEPLQIEQRNTQIVRGEKMDTISNGNDSVHSAKRARTEEDDLYFKSYSDISIHEEMIRDTVRTNTYRLAILRSVDQLAGKIVLDVGAGTGILSCFCVQAGAKKVYAIEASNMAEQAAKVVEANGMKDKIQVIHARVEEVNLPEKVDVIVSEWMGHFLLYESMLNSVIYARDKWLKKGGLILPSKATLFLSPITNEEIYKERIQFWEDVKGKYGVDMTCLTGFAKKCVFGQVQLEEVLGSDVIGNTCQIAELDINTATLKDLNKVMEDFSFKCFGSLPLCGFVSWFTVTFDIPEKEPLIISTAPNKHTTHWKQCVMYLDEPVPVEQDTIISGHIQMTPGVKHKRSLDVSLKYQVGSHNSVRRKYYMGPEEDS